MKKFFWLLFLIALVACASPAPSPTPLPATAPVASVTATALPVRSPVKPAAPGLAVQDAKTKKQTDGSLVTTAQVSAENLGLGEINLAYPETMLMNESRTIRLKLAPAQQLAAITPVAKPAKTPDLPSFVYKFGGNIDLYPLMIAELHAIKFDVKPAGPQRRNVDPTKEVTWDWVISPLAAGHQEVSIELSIPAVVNGVESQLSTDVLKNLAFTIDVQAVQPSLWSRILDSIAGNAGAILVALIGLLGTILGIVAKMQADKKSARASRK